MMTFFITALNTVCILTGNKDRDKLKKKPIIEKKREKSNQGKKRKKSRGKKENERKQE